MTDYDRDPEALAWARAKVQAEIDRCRTLADQADTVGKSDQADVWRRLANRMERVLIGGKGCVLGRFDERLPRFAKAVDNAPPSPID